jgi:hypothetical protein
MSVRKKPLRICTVPALAGLFCVTVPTGYRWVHKYHRFGQVHYIDSPNGIRKLAVVDMALVERELLRPVSDAEMWAAHEAYNTKMKNTERQRRHARPVEVVRRVVIEHRGKDRQAEYLKYTGGPNGSIR